MPSTSIGVRLARWIRDFAATRREGRAIADIITALFCEALGAVLVRTIVAVAVDRRLREMRVATGRFTLVEVVATVVGTAAEK